MDCRGDERGEIRRNEFAAPLRYLECASKQRLCGGSSKADDDAWLNSGDFGVEPWTACGNLHRARLRVDAALAARLPVEMLYGVRYVDFAPVDSGGDQRLIQHRSCGTDEGLPGEVFFVAGLLAYKHDFRVRGTFSENRLRSLLPEIAAATFLRSLAQNRESAALGEELCSGSGEALWHELEDAALWGLVAFRVSYSLTWIALSLRIFAWSSIFITHRQLER
jgi:hypothetical protein